MSIDSHGVEPDGSQEWGVARYRGFDETGPIAISVYGRDDRDAQLLAKSFRSVFYRDSGPTITLTRLQQVEHEAYLTLLQESRHERRGQSSAGRAWGRARMPSS